MRTHPAHHRFARLQRRRPRSCLLLAQGTDAATGSMCMSRALDRHAPLASDEFAAAGIPTTVIRPPLGDRSAGRLAACAARSRGCSRMSCTRGTSCPACSGRSLRGEVPARSLPASIACDRWKTALANGVVERRFAGTRRRFVTNSPTGSRLVRAATGCRPKSSPSFRPACEPARPSDVSRDELLRELQICRPMRG